MTKSWPFVFVSLRSPFLLNREQPIFLHSCSAEFNMAENEAVKEEAAPLVSNRHICHLRSLAHLTLPQPGNH